MCHWTPLPRTHFQANKWHSLCPFYPPQTRVLISPPLLCLLVHALVHPHTHSFTCPLLSSFSVSFPSRFPCGSHLPSTHRVDVISAQLALLSALAGLFQTHPSLNSSVLASLSCFYFPFPRGAQGSHRCTCLSPPHLTGLPASNSHTIQRNTGIPKLLFLGNQFPFHPLLLLEQGASSSKKLYRPVKLEELGVDTHTHT